MGSWNETCVLTRTPIHAGEPVRAIHVFPQLSASTPGGIGYNPLMLGLPILAQYDDYGGVEQVANPALEALTLKALAHNPFYRAHPLQRKHGGNDQVYVVNGPRAFFALEGELQFLFYDELGIKPSITRSHRLEAHALTKPGYDKAKAALKSLSTALKGELPTEDIAFYDALFEHASTAFGAQRAWPAYQKLLPTMVTAPQLLLMHEAAYQAVIAEFGSRKVFYYGDSAKMPLREFLAQELDNWLAKVEQKTARNQKLGIEPDDDDEMFDIMQEVRSKHFKPISQPWMSCDTPLRNHFWEGATVEEVLAAVPRDELLDFFVFQWARNYLRLDLYVPGSGSQNEEVVVLQKMMAATFKNLRAKGKLKKDFYGCLHR